MKRTFHPTLPFSHPFHDIQYRRQHEHFHTTRPRSRVCIATTLDWFYRDLLQLVVEPRPCRKGNYILYEPEPSLTSAMRLSFGAWPRPYPVFRSLQKLIDPNDIGQSMKRLNAVATVRQHRLPVAQHHLVVERIGCEIERIPKLVCMCVLCYGLYSYGRRTGFGVYNFSTE